MILHLFQPIPYTRIPLKNSLLEECWDLALERADSMETGSELCLVLNSGLEVVDYGWKEPPNEEDALCVEMGVRDKERPHDFAIAPQTWHFEQLAYLPEKDDIKSACGPYVAEGVKNPLFIRLIKENALELVVQLLWLPNHS